MLDEDRLFAEYYKERLRDETLLCEEGYVVYNSITYGGVPCIYIRELYVKFPLRGKGYSRLLVEEVVRIGKESKAKVLAVMVEKRTEFLSKALSYWLHLGLEVTTITDSAIWLSVPLDKWEEVNGRNWGDNRMDNMRNGRILYDERRSMFGNYVKEKNSDSIVSAPDSFMTYKFLPYKGEEVCFIKETYTRRSKRSEGLCRELAARVEEECKDKGIDKVVTTVDLGSVGVDRDLYLFIKYGFSVDQVSDGMIWLVKELK